jgi:hypothetical protein
MVNFMAGKIEVYIRNKEVLVQRTFVRGPSDHPCMDKESLIYERVMPDVDRLTLEVVTDFAKEKGLQVEICDISTFKGKLKASVKGINKTPTVIIGKSRIEGEFASELLRSKLESTLTS